MNSSISKRRARTASALALCALLLSSATDASAADALIVSAPGGLYPTIVSHLTTYLTSGGYTVTNVTSVPADLSPYAQVWDVRYDTALAAGDTTTYTTYLAAGGSVVLIGENPGFNVRNNTITTYVAARGGGTLGAITGSGGAQTIQPPFTGPDPVTTITWAGASKTPTAGTGSFIATDGTGGTAILFGSGTLTGSTGRLIVVFDVNILFDTGVAIEIALTNNIITYLGTSSTPPPPTIQPGPPALPPTITSIADQIVPAGGSTTVSFTVDGAVIAYALSVRANASNTTLVPRLTLNRLDSAGHWTLTAVSADGRSGSAVITVTVSDGTRETSTTFTVSTPLTTTVTNPLLSMPPSNLVASPSGSGVTLTWNAPAGGSPARYAVSASPASDASNVSVFVTPDASTRYVIPMVPPGTYSFRVQAIDDVLGPSSNDATVTTTGSPVVPGMPTGAIVSVQGNDASVSWTPPTGLTPPLYVVEVGTTAGASDVAVVTTAEPTYMHGANAGLYFLRVRSLNGAATSAPSNETSIPVGLGPCTAAPFAPVLLPVSRTSTAVTFSWLPPASWIPSGATIPATYRVDVTNGSGAATGVTTAGAGTSATGTLPPGAYRVSVTAANQCGVSRQSNEITFTQP